MTAEGVNDGGGANLVVATEQINDRKTRREEIITRRFVASCLLSYLRNQEQGHARRLRQYDLGVEEPKSLKKL